MARKKVSVEEQERHADAVARAAPIIVQPETLHAKLQRSGSLVGSVQRLPIPDAALLVTIGPNDQAWSDEKIVVEVEAYRGMYVRIQPPHSADDARVEAMRLAVQLAGAEAVVVAPRAKGPGVIAQPAADRSAAASSRAVVMTMATEANTRDRAALMELLEGFLAKVGL